MGDLDLATPPRSEKVLLRCESFYQKRFMAHYWRSVAPRNTCNCWSMNLSHAQYQTVDAKPHRRLHTFKETAKTTIVAPRVSEGDT